MNIERYQIPPGMRLHPERRHYLCASEVAAAAGFDEYLSPLAVYAEKTGLLPPRAETPAMRRGRHGEAMAIEYLRDELPGWRFVRPHVFLADHETRLGATPDCLTEDIDSGALVNVQIKIVARPVFEKWADAPDGGTKIAPVGYQLQVTAENMLLDAGLGLLAVLVMSAYDAELHLFDVPRHAAAEARLVELAQKFWENVRAGRRPAPDFSRDAETIERLFPPSAAVAAPLDLSRDNRIGAVLDRREELKQAIRTGEAEVKALDAEIVDRLRGAEKATGPGGWLISRTMQHRGEYVVPASDHPVLRAKRMKEAA